MNARSLLLTLSVVILATTHLANAQQAGKVPRVGLLISASIAVTAPYIEAFRQGLRELGYIEGKNIVLEIRGARRTPIEFPIWPLSWSILKSTSSSREAALQSVLPSKRPARFPLS
ncbi:MAG TPA: hypothetical protein VLJ79_30430 [Candidatus Binatia bacterium]|nr:hypothetical protein [Candidatus Binatia bacterium]